MSNDQFELHFNSELCIHLLNHLNSATLKNDAEWSVDIISGGFKFSDEIPQSASSLSDDLRLPLVTLLRILWGYRISLVSGHPRTDLEKWWCLAKEHAPLWAGFCQKRCSSDAKLYLDECRMRLLKFSEDIDKFP